MYFILLFIIFNFISRKKLFTFCFILTTHLSCFLTEAVYNRFNCIVSIHLSCSFTKAIYNHFYFIYLFIIYFSHTLLCFHTKVVTRASSLLTSVQARHPVLHVFDQSLLSPPGGGCLLCSRSPMCAHYLTEDRKLQAVIEQVMVDQLSRAVISDPEQNAVSVSPTSVPLRYRRTLHHTKVKTRMSLTENILSNKLCFQARILSRCGREACRKLIGFFFTCDQTLTVYEYRNFGKNRWNALPFITRGVYLNGGRPYCLQDIYQGAELRFCTDGPHLPQSLRQQPCLTLRVTDVDDTAKRALVYAPLTHAHAHTHTHTHTRDFEAVWRIVSRRAEGRVHPADVMRAVTGEMSENRKAVFLKVYVKLDPNKTGSIFLSDTEKFYRGKQESDAALSKLSLLLTDNSILVTKTVSYAEFEDYYEGLSIEIPDDEEYISNLRATWSI
uniref:Calcyphosine 2 n=1 Tax=Cyprinus carpio TaxID=7962 RepID=A0A8C1Y5G2_CYPCA